MSALDDLQRSLSRAVADGRAGDPATARRRSGRRRPRRGWHVFIAILLAGGVTTGALAATGQLRIVGAGDQERNMNYPVFAMPGQDTRPTADPTLLPLRVADPQGGPVWALRTFPIGRGRVCAQAGQLYAGRFGVVTQVLDRARQPKDARGPAWSTTVFQELPAAAGVLGVRCGAARPGGAIVAAMRDPTILGKKNGDLRCGNSPAPADADCRIRSVRVVRWGFLGPKAETATFIRPGGERGPTQRLDVATGGAYLFAEPLDPAPFRASRAFEAELRRKIDEEYPRVRYGSIPKAERPAADRRWRARNREVQLAYRASRSQRRANWRAQQAEAVDAVFAGGEARRVAGPGAKGGLLPGVPPVENTVPVVPAGGADIAVRFRGPDRAAEVRFASPVPLDHRPGLYTISVRGPVGPDCRRNVSVPFDYARETRRGAPVVVPITIAGYLRLGPDGQVTPGEARWCAGRTYVVRVRHVVHNHNKPGYRSEQPVGTTSFVAR